MILPQERGQSWERVRLTIDAAGVADVVLDRPPANAIDLATLAELEQVAAALTADSAVRVVMLRSAVETIFAAGFDPDMLGHAWGRCCRQPPRADTVAHWYLEGCGFDDQDGLLCSGVTRGCGAEERLRLAGLGVGFETGDNLAPRVARVGELVARVLVTPV